MLCMMDKKIFLFVLTGINVALTVALLLILTVTPLYTRVEVRPVEATEVAPAAEQPQTTDTATGSGEQPSAPTTRRYGPKETVGTFLSLARMKDAEKGVAYCVNSYSSKPVDENAWFVKYGITGNLRTAVTKRIGTVNEKPDSIYTLCYVQKQVFLITFADYSIATPIGFVADDEGNYNPMYYQPVATMDAYINLMPHPNNSTDVIVHTGYGDAGHAWWTFYRLNPLTRTTDVLEGCADSPVFPASPDYSPEDLDRELACVLEYKP